MIPRPYQTTAVEETWQYLTRHKGSPLIVLPTGAGKSWVIAMLIQRARAYGGRVITLAHRKELLKQNHDKIQSLLDEPVGIYSAGLKQRDTSEDVIVAGVQSVYGRAEEFGERNLIIVDEAHLISNAAQTMYGKLLSKFPNARLIGLTATPYRTGYGPIAGRKRIFRKISHEVAVTPLMEQGYLSPITFNPTTQIDTSKLGIRNGEYIAGEMELLFGKQPVVERACLEIAALSEQRKSVLVFCSGVSHAEYVREQLERITGQYVGCVTGDTIPLERTEMLRRFSKTELRIMVNCDVLTTGFDSPYIDCIAVLRATLSPGLFAQMVGRGFRIACGKQDCLLLDFGGNRARHGDPHHEDYGRVTGTDPETSEEKAAAKNSRGRPCLNCETDIPTGESQCYDCGYVIPLTIRHEESADVGNEVLDWEVMEVFYGLHKKRTDPEAPPTLRADYHLREIGQSGNLAGTSASEWVCFEHQGFALRKAAQWWDKRSKHPMPSTVQDALDVINRHGTRSPWRLTTKRDGKWKRVEHVEFRDAKPDVEELQEVVVSDDPFGSEIPF